jgi:hypothetical protein
MTKLTLEVDDGVAERVATGRQNSGLLPKR